MDTFQEEHYTSYEEFKDLGIETARPMADEYKRLFIHPSGDYTPIVSAYMAARVLNPLVAADMDDEQMRDAIKDLSHFGFDEFRPGNGIINDLLEEIPVYRAALDSTDESFWSKVEGAAEYDEDLRKKAEATSPEKSIMDVRDRMIKLKSLVGYGSGGKLNSPTSPTSFWQLVLLHLFQSQVLLLNVLSAK